MKDKNPRPYLSLVVVGRNDNYGEGFLDRFQLFLNNQFFLWEKHKLDAELVIVEWNPPGDAPPLRKALTWPKRLSVGSVRVITVPSAVHRRLPGSDRQHFFEYVGKNVGARRARGEYVLGTNPDLLSSDELIAFFAERRLKKDAVYRVDRYDVPRNILLPLLSPKEALSLADQHFRYIHNNYGAMFVRGENLFGMRNVRRMATYLKNRIKFSPYPPPYMNAAGDFFLMHRDSWMSLRGYPEIPPFAYPDALCFMALSAGLTQTALTSPMRIYHQDHGRGGPETGRPISDFERNRERYLTMLREKKPWIPNSSLWGFMKENLPEEQIL